MKALLKKNERSRFFTAYTVRRAALYLALNPELPNQVSRSSSS